MSVVVELTIPGRGFQLGRALGDVPGTSYELERIVPTADASVPFLWVRGGDTGPLEAHLSESPLVSEFSVLDRIDEWALYRIDWAAGYDGMLEEFATLDVTTLSARGNDVWRFRLRFPDHDAVSRFYEYTQEQDLPVTVERVYSLSEEDVGERPFGLTSEQREALVLALERGYFETPSETSLEELSTELGISRQALSERIRRGTRQVLAHTILTAGSDSLAPTER